MPLLRSPAQRSDPTFMLLTLHRKRSATSQIARSTIRRGFQWTDTTIFTVPLLRSPAQRSDLVVAATIRMPLLCHFSDRPLNDPTIARSNSGFLSLECHFSDRPLNDPTKLHVHGRELFPRATSQIARSTIRPLNLAYVIEPDAGATSQIARSTIRRSGSKDHGARKAGATSQIARSTIRPDRPHKEAPPAKQCHFSDRPLNDPTRASRPSLFDWRPCHFSDRPLNDPTMRQHKNPPIFERVPLLRSPAQRSDIYVCC
ncbi:hypothetical protein SAMN05421543_10119 [Alicyclobacillus macrosporangiidus]|uniref:Uncharacterized protein n=1 Tax=Alicyclobacillus macrosporangiidus TaxID=392015 RepID=A0A1I7F1S8_9BACL|nr:hypothetical protein SAMN05421543_10119 [Alicyclobacillus macrosporangiidus]